MTSPFEKLKIMVLGEVGIDEYLDGTSNRTSPESGVPVITDIRQTVRRPGMAGNVLRNLQALGAEADLYTVIGNDEFGSWLGWELGCSMYALEVDEVKTIKKTRINSNGKPIARLDHEKIGSISWQVAEDYLDLVYKSIDKYNAIILQDYGKYLWNQLTLKVIEYAKRQNVPVFIDPFRHRNVSYYRGAYLIKANADEAEAYRTPGIGYKDTARLMSEISGANVVITSGSGGMSACWDGVTYSMPAEKVTVTDVCGAGDTALAMLTLSTCAAFGSALELANKAAALSIQKLGPSVVTWEELCRSYPSLKSF